MTLSAPTRHRAAGEAVLEHSGVIADELVAREFARHPELAQRYGTVARAKSRQDAGYHLSFLAQALASDSQALFLDYIAWAKVMLGQRHVSASDLAFHLECLAAVLSERLPGEPGALAAAYVTAAVAAMPGMPEDMPTFLQAGAPLSPLAHQYLEALRRGERQLASGLILSAVAAGTPVKEIYLRVFQPAQHEIGRLWQMNQISVAQEHFCTAATQLVMSQLYGHVFASSGRTRRSLVATCVAGDLHEIGVRMVADFFEMAGWDTYYLGASMPDAGVIASIVDRRAEVLAVSATISYHVEAVRRLIAAVRRAPGCERVKILVGGYPFNREPGLWERVGADGSAVDAEQAIELAGRWVAGGSA